MALVSTRNTRTKSSDPDSSGRCFSPRVPRLHVHDEDRGDEGYEQLRNGLVGRCAPYTAIAPADSQNNVRNHSALLAPFPKAAQQRGLDGQAERHQPQDMEQQSLQRRIQRGE